MPMKAASMVPSPPGVSGMVPTSRARAMVVGRGIVRRARTAGLASAVVFRGFEGYEASNGNHTTRILVLSDDLPLCVAIVNNAETIDAFLDQLGGVIGGSDIVAVMKDVQR